MKFVFNETDKNGKHVGIGIISISGRGYGIYKESSLGCNIELERCSIHPPIQKPGILKQMPEYRKSRCNSHEANDFICRCSNMGLFNDE